MGNKSYLLKTLALPLIYSALCVVLLSASAGRALRGGLFHEREQRVLAGLSAWKKAVFARDFSNPDTLLLMLDRPALKRLFLRRATILDNKGRILASTEAGLAGGADQDGRVLDMLLKGESGFLEEKNSGRPGRSLLFSFVRENKAAGGAKFLFDTGDLERAVGSAQNRLAAITAFLSLAIVFLMAFSVDRRESLIRELKQGLLVAGSGNFRFGLKGRYRGISAGAVRAFNDLLVFLKSREEKRGHLTERLKGLAVVKAFSDLFDRTIRMAREELGARHVMVLVIRGDNLIVSAKDGYGDDAVRKEESYAASEAVFAEIMEYGRPLIITDKSEIRQNERYAALAVASGPVALFPMTQANEIYGIIHVGKGEGAPPFTSTEIEAGEALACGAAVAMAHFTAESEAEGGVDRAPAAPAALSFTGHPELRMESFSVSQKGRTHVIDFSPKADERVTLLFIRSGASLDSRGLNERIKGAEGVAVRLRTRLNDLSFFALSVLSKMPPSEQREKYLKKFSDNPFTAQGVRALIREMLVPACREIQVEAIAFDLKNHVCEPALEGLCAARLPAAGGAHVLSGSQPFTKGDMVLVLPRDLLRPGELDAFKPGEGVSAVLSRLREKYGGLPEITAAVIQRRSSA